MWPMAVAMGRRGKRKGEPREGRQNNPAPSVPIMSPLPGLEAQLGPPLSPTAVAVGHNLSALPGLRVCAHPASAGPWATLSRR
jgi:hypothetical protein